MNWEKNTFNNPSSYFQSSYLSGCSPGGKKSKEVSQSPRTSVLDHQQNMAEEFPAFQGSIFDVTSDFSSPFWPVDLSRGLGCWQGGTVMCLFPAPFNPCRCLCIFQVSWEHPAPSAQLLAGSRGSGELRSIFQEWPREAEAEEVEMDITGPCWQLWALFIFFPYYWLIPSVYPTLQMQEGVLHFGEAIAGMKVSGFWVLVPQFAQHGSGITELDWCVLFQRGFGFLP